VNGAGAGAIAAECHPVILRQAQRLKIPCSRFTPDGAELWPVDGDPRVGLVAAGRLVGSLRRLRPLVLVQGDSEEGRRGVRAVETLRCRWVIANRPCYDVVGDRGDVLVGERESGRFGRSR
jgi:hypothetical protein